MSKTIQSEKRKEELENLYKVAVHTAIHLGKGIITPAFLQRFVFVPINEGWNVAVNYDRAVSLLERMEREKIVQKQEKGGYLVIRKRAPFSLSKELQQTFKQIQQKKKQREEPGKRLSHELSSWIQCVTGAEELTAPYDFKMISYKHDVYTYQITKNGEQIAERSFDMEAIMKHKKTA